MDCPLPSSYWGTPIYGNLHIIPYLRYMQFFFRLLWVILVFIDLQGQPAAMPDMEGPVLAGLRMVVQPSAFCARRGSCALPCGVHRSQ